MLTIPYTTVYCPPMTYEFIIPQSRGEVKRKLVIRTHQRALLRLFSRVPRLKSAWVRIEKGKEKCTHLSW